MELELSPDQQELADSVRSFVETECPISLVRQVVEEGKEADELWAHMVALDWPALVVPESAGGVGLGQVELAVVAEQLGRVLAPAPFLAVAQFVSALRHAGSDAQQERFLGAVAGGQLVGTVALTESSGRLDWSDVRTTATATADGGWKLRGEKHAVLDAAKAEEVVVAARTPGSTGAEGIGLFVVPQDALDVAPFHSLDATRQLGTVRITDAVVGAERCLGTPGEIGAALERIVLECTAAVAAEMVGTSQAIFDIVHAYVLEREQFGVKIGSFQSMKHKLANMFVALESARATAYFAAAALAEGDERAALAVHMAKSSTDDCQRLLAQEGIQCLGGIGYTWEHDMHLYVKRQKVQAALFGTGDEHRAAIADAMGM